MVEGKTENNSYCPWKQTRAPNAIQLEGILKVKSEHYMAILLFFFSCFRYVQLVILSV